MIGFQEGITVGIGAEVRLTAQRWKNVNRIDVRFFFKDQELGWKATKRGVVIPMSKFPEFKGIVDKMWEEYLKGDFGTNLEGEEENDG